MANKQHYFHCHGCGRPFPWRGGAPIVCSNKCRKKLDDHHASIHDRLMAEGFEQDGNWYTKHGYSVTLEEVKYVGLDKALAHAWFAGNYRGK